MNIYQKIYFLQKLNHTIKLGLSSISNPHSGLNSLIDSSLKKHISSGKLTNNTIIEDINKKLGGK